jgi:hypothetical protein
VRDGVVLSKVNQIPKVEDHGGFDKAKGRTEKEKENKFAAS